MSANHAPRPWEILSDRSAPVEDPLDAYQAFLDAIARRDIGAMLARMTETYGAYLRSNGDSVDFGPFLQLFCESYPTLYELDLESSSDRIAYLKTRGHHEGLALWSRVTLERDADIWRVADEVFGPDQRKV